MQGLPLIQNARIADKMGLFGHLRRFEKIRKKVYIIYIKYTYLKVIFSFLYLIAQSINIDILFLQKTLLCVW